MQCEHALSVTESELSSALKPKLQFLLLDLLKQRKKGLIMQNTRPVSTVTILIMQWRRKMLSIGGAGLALWCLSNQSSSTLVGAGERLPRGEKLIKKCLLHFEPISTSISLINLSSYFQSIYSYTHYYNYCGKFRLINQEPYNTCTPYSPVSMQRALP